MAKTRIQTAIEEGRVRLVRDETPTIQTTVTKLAKANPNRRQVVVINPTANAMRVAFTSDVSTSRGFYVAPNGQLQFLWEEDGEACFKELFAILETASGSVHVMEWEVYDG